MTERHQYDPDSDTLAFPDDTLVGIIDDPDAVEEAIGDLTDAGVPEDGIQVLCCEDGARRLDPSGKRHGGMERLRRIVQNFGDEDRKHVRRQADEMRAGRFLISVLAEGEEERDRLTNILKERGGHFINHYTSWTVTQLEP